MNATVAANEERPHVRVRLRPTMSSDIEFVLSVCIFPYPNYVMSVWVYIAVLYKS